MEEAEERVCIECEGCESEVASGAELVAAGEANCALLCCTGEDEAERAALILAEASERALERRAEAVAEGAEVFG